MPLNILSSTEQTHTQSYLKCFQVQIFLMKNMHRSYFPPSIWMATPEKIPVGRKCIGVEQILFVFRWKHWRIKVKKTIWKSGDKQRDRRYRRRWRGIWGWREVVDRRLTTYIHFSLLLQQSIIIFHIKFRYNFIQKGFGEDNFHIFG